MLVDGGNGGSGNDWGSDSDGGSGDGWGSGDASVADGSWGDSSGNNTSWESSGVPQRVVSDARGSGGSAGHDSRQDGCLENKLQSTDTHIINGVGWVIVSRVVQ